MIKLFLKEEDKLKVFLKLSSFYFYKIYHNILQIVCIPFYISYMNIVFDNIQVCLLN